MSKIIEITEDQIRDIGKASSALRFSAGDGNGMERTQSACEELCRIAHTLWLIEMNWVYGKTPASVVKKVRPPHGGIGDDD